MDMSIQIAKRRFFKSEDIWAMHRLRAKVFKDRMGWEVPILSGMEIDGYDAVDPAYMLIKDKNGNVKGCWRVLPTQGPYMLKDSFPQLLQGKDAPEESAIWELSRWAVETDSTDKASFGFTNLTIECLKEMMAYGKKNNVSKFITVTTTAIERLLRKSGCSITRLGPPMRIGIENAVALYFDVDKTYEALNESLSIAA